MSLQFRQGQQAYNQLVRNLSEYDRLIARVDALTRNLKIAQTNAHIIRGLRGYQNLRRIEALNQEANRLQNLIHRAKHNFGPVKRRILQTFRVNPNMMYNDVNFFRRKLKILQERRLSRALFNAMQKRRVSALTGVRVGPKKEAIPQNVLNEIIRKGNLKRFGQ